MLGGSGLILPERSACVVSGSPQERAAKTQTIHPHKI